MGTATLPVLAPFALFQRVIIPSMMHLGSGRVLACRYAEHPVSGLAWLVTLKLAASGEVLTLTASYVKGA